MLKRKDFHRLAASQQFISGIYNYCDRWCKRCPQILRCLSFATEQLDAGASATFGDEMGLERVRNLLEIAGEMIEDIARCEGIDLNDDSTKECCHQETEPLLTRRAKIYLQTTHDWMSKNEFVISGQFYTRETPKKLRLVAADRLELIFEEIVRYALLIMTKIDRALWYPAGPNGREANLYDANGSAKVALLAMDQSIAAWKQIGQRADMACDPSSFITSLEQMVRLLEQTLPAARSFSRPGFDDASTTS